jgi:dihydroorotate dehydrogenase
MPRIIRFPHQHALLNRMGFPNPGAQAVARRLAARPPNTVVGVNVGKSKAAPAPSTLADYRSSVRQLAPLADYLVVNVSSPNTPGLRDLQAVDSLRPLVAGIRDELTASDQPVPLLVKIAPDLADEDIDAITALALEQGLDGLVAVNTTLDRAGVGNAEAPFEGGGVSGPPLKAKALHVLRRIRATAGDRLTIVSVGGVGTADDVWERLRAGATLVQAYTALVYEGPAWPGRVNRQLAEKVRAAGLDSVQAIVGADAARRSPAYPAHRVH